MNRYCIKEQIGAGTFGTVYRATKIATGQEFAIKCFRGTLDWSTVTALRELQTMMRVSRHANIVGLEEVHVNYGNACLVLEYMADGSLYDCVAHHAAAHQFLQSETISNYVRQVLLGLAHLHAHSYMHRDVKPENILVNKGKVKLADFSLSCQGGTTSYVSTRWYRAPEIMMCKTYSYPIDLFAVGCVVAELTSLQPLFPGTSEVDQLQKIGAVMNTDFISGGGATAANSRSGGPMTFQVRQPSSTESTTTPKERLQRLVPNASATAIDLMVQLLQVDPAQRITAADALQHAFIVKSTVSTQLPDKDNVRAPMLKTNTSTLAVEATTRASSSPPLETDGLPLESVEFQSNAVKMQSANPSVSDCIFDGTLLLPSADSRRLATRTTPTVTTKHQDLSSSATTGSSSSTSTTTISSSSGSSSSSHSAAAPPSIIVDTSTTTTPKNPPQVHMAVTASPDPLRNGGTKRTLVTTNPYKTKAAAADKKSRQRSLSKP